jgi:hypothetical protein
MVSRHKYKLIMRRIAINRGAGNKIILVSLKKKISLHSSFYFGYIWKEKTEEFPLFRYSSVQKY